MMITGLPALPPAHNLGVADTAAGEPEGPDGGTDGGLRVWAGGGGGERQQHLKCEVRGLVMM